MKCIFILFDSLNRSVLPPYGGEADLPNFKRLADRGTVFDSHFVGSMPCIPARREIHTGRLNFLHRGWGPLEPFDVSFATALQNAGIYSHLITDHYHYFEDGGYGYHGRYDSYEFIRGQEKDKWKSTITPGLQEYQRRFDPSQRDATIHPNGKAAYYASHRQLSETKSFPLSQCFDAAIDFVDAHDGVDNWMLHLECFDPHEPFFLGPDEPAEGPDGGILDWPKYDRNDLDDPSLQQLRDRYHKLVARCDAELGRLLDRMDALNLWEDTAVILTTDHGLLLGEKEFLGKNRPPFFNEVAQIPLIVSMPAGSGETLKRVEGLTQTIDLMPTFLDLFGVDIPAQVGGRSLLPVLKGQKAATHDAVIFGQHGAALNYTDGERTCFLYPDNRDGELYQYTLMPTHMRTHFELLEFDDAQVVRDLPYANGFPVWKLRVHPDAKANMLARYPLLDAQDVVYDLREDPKQLVPYHDAEALAGCRKDMAQVLTLHHAPSEIFDRFGLDKP